MEVIKCGYMQLWPIAIILGWKINSKDPNNAWQQFQKLVDFFFALNYLIDLDILHKFEFPCELLLFAKSLCGKGGCSDNCL